MASPVTAKCSLFNTKRKFKKHSFDNAVFIEDVYRGQRVFTRILDERLVKELITYVIRRVKQVIDNHVTEDRIDDTTYTRRPQNAAKRRR